MIAVAAEVLMATDRLAKEIKNPPATVSALVKAYAEDDEPWCLLDTHHRHMESRKYNFEFAAGGEHQELEKLVTKAEHRYTELGSQLAKHFVTQLSKAKHPIRRPAAAARHFRYSGRETEASRYQGRPMFGLMRLSL